MAVLGDRARVVVEAVLVGGADLAERRAAGLQDFGDAEAAADLTSSPREMTTSGRRPSEVAQDEDGGRGAVVDDGGGLVHAEDGEVVST